MRPLIIDDAAKAAAKRLIDYATSHHYWPGQPTPGDNPNFVAKLNTYRVVFTFTHASGKVFRHLSVSVPSRRFPHPAAVFMIADLFGFTGWDQRTLDQPPDGWIINISENEHCIVLAQEVQNEASVPTSGSVH